MLKFSLIKAATYIGVFIFGYSTGHFNVDRIFADPSAHQAQTPQTHSNLIANCPVAKPTCPADLKTQPLTPPQMDTVIHPEKESSKKMSSAITINDFDNPDEQISLALIEEPNAFTQTNEQLVGDLDPLAPLFQLTEEKQLDYIQKLVESQDDSAIVALNDLILNDNPPIQHAAIDGLISLLEMRTGHFAMIAENLEQNAVFLNDEQLQKLQKITQTAATP